MSQPRDDRPDDLFRPALEKIIDLCHPLVRLAGTIDWDFLARHFSSACRVGPGQPPLPTRLVAGCSFSNTCTISPTRCCATDGWRTRTSNTSVARWCSATRRPSIVRRCPAGVRLGEEHIPRCCRKAFRWHRPGAIETKDLEQVAVDTTVQEKAITHPSDARLTHRAIEKLVKLAKREDVELRQSYLRLAKRAAIMVGRYTHAHQFKRARRQLKFPRTRLGRINKLARTFVA